MATGRGLGQDRARGSVMNSEELHAAVMKTSGLRETLITRILAGDHQGARVLAESLDRETLVAVGLLSAHEMKGSLLSALEQNLTEQQAREAVTERFRVFAAPWGVARSRKENRCLA